MNNEELLHNLNMFMGTEQYWRVFPPFKTVMTDGAKYLADTAECYWLMTDIAIFQNIHKVRIEPFQVWRLTVNEDRSARLVMDDGNDNERYTAEYPYTTFPLPKIKLYVAYADDDMAVIMLPNEY